jgi:hypothetical protein
MYDCRPVSVKFLIGTQAHACCAAGTQSLGHNLIFDPGLTLIFVILKHYSYCSFFSNTFRLNKDMRDKSIPHQKFYYRIFFSPCQVFVDKKMISPIGDPRPFLIDEPTEGLAISSGS